MNLLDSAIAQRVIDEGMSCGADFSEVYVEHNRHSHIQVLNQGVHELKGGIDYGIGIRLLFGTEVLYGFTNRKDVDSLLTLTRNLAQRFAMTKQADPAALNACQAYQYNDVSDLNTPDLVDQKIALLLSIDKAARATHNDINQVSAGVAQRCQRVEIFNSEGLHAGEARHYTRLNAAAIAEANGEQAQGSESPGGFQGWEAAANWDGEALGKKVAEQAITKLGAPPCPAGKMPVIIDNGFGGVIFHEACGHLLETTSVQKKSSVFWDRMGETIASECVNYVDDGTLDGAWGSIAIDDEGMPTQRTQLIKDGKLTAFLSDRVGELKTGHKRTGSGRRQHYGYAPASRMRNTFIEAGNTPLDDMIASVDYGLYAKRMGGGSVQPGTGEFNFNVGEAYLIEKGKIGKPVKSATLIGSGEDILKQVSMVGTDLDLGVGMCGSVSGSVPVTVGQPAIKVDNILVGGTA